MTAHAVSPAGFTAAVSAITDAFGDPTRRRIYLYLRDEADTHGATAADVAAEVGVHPNVARHHLDKLAAGGYVEVLARAVDALAERRAGRPSKRMSSTRAGWRTTTRCSESWSTLIRSRMSGFSRNARISGSASIRRITG